MCSLDVSLYGVMMSWGFYEFDELSFDEMTAFKYFSEGLFFVTSSRKGINYGMLHTVEHFKWTKVTL